eukprot:9487311-Pyramimonas_sp.AAC.2
MNWTLTLPSSSHSPYKNPHRCMLNASVSRTYLRRRPPDPPTHPCAVSIVSPHVSRPQSDLGGVEMMPLRVVEDTQALLKCTYDWNKLAACASNEHD